MKLPEAHGSLDVANTDEELTGYTHDETKLNEYLAAIHEAKSNRFDYYVQIVTGLLMGDSWQFVDAVAKQLLSGGVLDAAALGEIVPGTFRLAREGVLSLAKE